MDNLTHGLAGLVVAELACAYETRQTGRRPEWRGLACFTSFLAQNLPDSDFLFIGLTGGKLGYLVQHRGYTHTLLAVLPLALIALAPAALWLKARRRTLAPRGWAYLLGLAVVGGVMHVAMDGSNDYGVHPLWPLDPRWLYGDAIFIIEPLLWASAIPALLFLVRTRVAKTLLVLQLAGILTATFLIRDMVRLPTALLVTTWAVLVFVWARRLAPSRLPWLAAGAWATATLLFVLASARAEHVVRQAHAELHPEATLHDVILTPSPADPLCWRALTVSTTSTTYALRVAGVSLWPSAVTPEDCPRVVRDGTAPLVSEARRSVHGLLEVSHLVAPLSDVRATRTRCDVDTFLRWSRVPFWLFEPDALVVGDLRYDRERELGFAEVSLPRGAPEACPENVPTWGTPRSDVVGPRR